LLLVILLGGNLYFSVQYVQNLKQQNADTEQASSSFNSRLQVAQFLKEFIDTVLNTQGTVSFDNRVKLENDVLQIKDDAVTAQWKTFVGSKNNKEAQQNAVKLMALLADKML
ncbi:MAG: hypothetical protein WCI52_04290, partial [bacterium]